MFHQYCVADVLNRTIRYCGAIIRDDFILLVKQRLGRGHECWHVPGGGREPGESEEECVTREIWEETRLDVIVDGLLIDGPSHPRGPYPGLKICLCAAIGGTARPDAAETIEVGWFDYRSHHQIALVIVNNETTQDTMQTIRKARGHP